MFLQLISIRGSSDRRLILLVQIPIIRLLLALSQVKGTWHCWLFRSLSLLKLVREVRVQLLEVGHRSIELRVEGKALLMIFFKHFSFGEFVRLYLLLRNLHPRRQVACVDQLLLMDFMLLLLIRILLLQNILIAFVL